MPGVVFIPQRGADYWDCTFNGTVQHCVAGYYPANPFILVFLGLLILSIVIFLIWTVYDMGRGHG